MAGDPHADRQEWVGMNASKARRVLLAAGMLGLAAVAPSIGAEEKRLRFPLELERPQNGEKVRIEPGAPVLHLVFFATWCGPCVEELPRLANLEAKWVDRGYRLIIVAVPTRQSRERLLGFLREKTPPGALLFDGTGTVGSSCGVEQLPTHLLVGAGGEVIHRASFLSETLVREIEQRFGAGGGRAR